MEKPDTHKVRKNGLAGATGPMERPSGAVRRSRRMDATALTALTTRDHEWRLGRCLEQGVQGDPTQR